MLRHAASDRFRMNSTTYAPQPANRATILVVQNDPLLLGLVSGSLRPEGHQVIESSSPLEALNLSAQDFQAIDLVVTAVSCRPITGIEFARRLARRGVDVAVLYVSASQSLANAIAGSLGQSAVIAEPFTGAELRSRVRKCLAAQRRKTRRDSGPAD